MRKETSGDKIWERWLNEHYKDRLRPPQPTIHAIADITFLRTDEGGRSGPVASGYRGQFHNEGNETHVGAVYTFASCDPVQPGETTEVVIQFITPEAHAGHVYPGRGFEIREGLRAVARGHVTWVGNLEAER